jgi:hypothetical protein
VRGGVELTAGGQEPNEEELRARLEEELKRLRVEDVVLQSVVTLVNLGGQRLGLSEAGRELRDLGQTRTAIEAVRALLPLLEQGEGGAERVKPIRDALAQLQMAYAREMSSEEAPAAANASTHAEGKTAEEQPPRPPKGAAEQRRGGASGRLWVPPGSVR